MKIIFTHLNGSREGQVEEYTLPVINVGRGVESDIRIGDATPTDRVASRQHAEFRREGNHLVLYDLGSRNGTYVNGQRVNGQIELATHDLIELGIGGPAMRVQVIVSETEEIDFLQNSRYFGSLSQEHLSMVLSAGTLEVYPADSYLFRVGQACEYLYVIKSGVVEVWRDTNENGELDLTTYLGSGDVLGASSILLEGATHHSAARIPEGAVMLRLTQSVFRTLILTIPEFALAVCTALARQLDSTYKKLQTHSYKRLQGNLNFFDLATVIQTLIQSRQTGVLSVTALEVGFAHSGLWASSDDIEMPAATIHLVNGKVVYTRCGVLNGEEAFYQLFQSEYHGSFTFQEGAPPDSGPPQGTIHLPGFNLLLEAVRMQDELRQFKLKHPDPHVKYIPATQSLTWTESMYEKAAQVIWERLKRGLSIANLQGEVPYCDFVIYFVIDVLLDKGLLSVSGEGGRS